MEAGKDSLRTDDQAQVDKHDGADDGKGEQVPSADCALQHKYSVWAMMKQQMQQQADSYSAALKVVASFATVSHSPASTKDDTLLVNSHSKSC
jgi:hypothetical protein